MRGTLHGAWLLVFMALLPGLAQSQQATEPDLATLQAAAQAGDSAAQFDLGNRFLYGTGMIADEFEAARWFRLAAEQGNNNAQYNLGVMYMQGTGVLADMNEALRWFLSAANLGDAPAQFTLATLYANGRGVAKDPVMAHMWFTLAASGGHRAAAANLVLYQEMMMDADIIEAQRRANEWIQDFNATLAASAGNDDNAVANPGTP